MTPEQLAALFSIEVATREMVDTIIAPLNRFEMQWMLLHLSEQYEPDEPIGGWTITEEAEPSDDIPGDLLGYRFQGHGAHFGLNLYQLDSLNQALRDRLESQV